MKNRFFTLLVIAFISSSVSAQLHFDGHQDVYYGTASNLTEEVDADWDVVNSTDLTLDLSARRFAIQEVEGADGNFCWGFLCIAWSTGAYNASSEVATMNPGDVNTTFKAKYRHHGNPGQSIYRYCIYDVNGQIPMTCHTVNFCVDAECLVSTNDLPVIGGEIEVAPNPIEKVGTLSYRFNNAPHDGKMVVYNAVGAKVKEITLKSKEGVVFLGASDFTPGLYFCSIEDNGVAHQTVRIVFQ